MIIIIHHDVPSWLLTHSLAHLHRTVTHPLAPYCHSIKESSKFFSHQLTQMNAVFERHFNRVADLLESWMSMSRGSAPSPTRPDRDPNRNKRTRVAPSLEDDVDDDDDEEVEDEDEDDEPTSISRAVERERFGRITKKDMKKATDAQGKFDVLRFFAIHHKTFPVHYVLALIFFGALNSEANVERVFSYAGGVMSARRARLSAFMLEAMVIVAKNADTFSITTEELYNKYCELYTASYAIDASEVQDDDDDDEKEPES